MLVGGAKGEARVWPGMGLKDFFGGKSLVPFGLDLSFGARVSPAEVVPWHHSRCWIRSLMDEMSSRLTANWAVCWSTVSVLVFCCACIRSSFWPMLLSILCRACVIWTKWCASGGPDASRVGSPNHLLELSSGGGSKGASCGCQSCTSLLIIDFNGRIHGKKSLKS